MRKRERVERLMNERKYRAALIGLLAIVLLCGALIFMEYGEDKEMPTDGTLVKNCECMRDRVRTWA